MRRILRTCVKKKKKAGFKCATGAVIRKLQLTFTCLLHSPPLTATIKTQIPHQLYHITHRYSSSQIRDLSY